MALELLIFKAKARGSMIAKGQILASRDIHKLIVKKLESKLEKDVAKRLNLKKKHLYSHLLQSSSSLGEFAAVLWGESMDLDNRWTGY